jgi:polysaccharide biosynthesis/export protein
MIHWIQLVLGQTLNGDVANPGAQPYRPGMTVRQAIALAGGYDTMRFRGRDPFLDSSDFRGDYYELWTEFAKVRAQAERFQAELDGNSALGQPNLNDLPLPSAVTSKIVDVEAQRLSVDNSDHQKEKKYLEDAVQQEDVRIATLQNQRETEQKNADTDAAEFKEVQANFSKAHDTALGFAPTDTVFSHSGASDDRSDRPGGARTERIRETIATRGGP